MKKNNVVYLWKRNGEVFYVGIGSLKRSRQRHQRNDHCSRTRLLAEKENSFEIEVIYNNLTWDEACEIECQLIQQYGRRDLQTGQLTNMTNGGDGTPGRTPWNKGIPRTEETKRKISEANSAENCFHFGKTGINSVRYGTTHSDLTKKQMSKSRMKKVTTPLGTFDSCKDAAEAHGIEKSCMSRKVRNPKHNDYFYTG